MRNIFGQETFARPLGEHFLHATVVPTGRHFYSFIEVSSERALVYRRELPFTTLAEAQADLRAQLTFMQNVTIDDLHRIAALDLDYSHESFSLRDHREAAEKQRYTYRLDPKLKSQDGDFWEYTSSLHFNQPESDINEPQVEMYMQAIQAGKPLPPIIVDPENAIVDGHHRWMAAMNLSIEKVPIVIDYENEDYIDSIASEQEGEFDTHVPTSIDNPQPKLHYLSQRIAAAKLEHYSSNPNLTAVDPKFHGSGVSGIERRRKTNDPQNWVDRTYFYDAGTEPEAVMGGKIKYVADLPAGASIYDIATDPAHLAEQAKNPGGFGTDLTLLEKLIKDAGYFGFRNTQSALPNAVGVFYSVPVIKADDSLQRLEGEMILTTVFVKRAGSTENYLQSLGVSPEVIQFVVTQEANTAKRLVNEVRKNPQITIQQLQEVVESLAGKQKYEPTRREMAAANNWTDVPGMPEWVLLQAKKYRKKKVQQETSWPEVPEGLRLKFPPYEFEYEWPIQVLGRAGWSLSVIGPVLNQIADWVRNTGAQLASYDMATAKAASDKWHEEQAAQGAGQGYQDKLVVYTFANGWTIQEVRTENDLEVEGNLMGHCVGSYCNYVARGDSAIFSLRDQKNEPHVTIEVKPPSAHEPEDQLLTDTDVGYDPSKEQYKPYTTPMPNDEAQWEIVQIQGKSNAEPVDAYKKMIREWFESLGPKNITQQGSDTDLEDQIYNADPNDYADILNAGAEPNEYGLGGNSDPIQRFRREYNQNMQLGFHGLYNRIIQGLETYYGRRESTFIPRRMDPVAEAIADFAWDTDMREIMKVIEGVYSPEWNFQDQGPNSSALSGVQGIMDEHQEEFDRFGFEAGIPYPDEEDYETPAEYEKAMEKFYEDERELRDESYREWLKGGMDLAINDRWRERAIQDSKGLWPWEILANIKAGRDPYAPSERMTRDRAQAA
jgi:hypothetical protein